MIKYVKYKNKYLKLKFPNSIYNKQYGGGITVEDIFKMSKEELKKINIDLISSLLLEYGFPLKKNIINEDQVHEMFKNLGEYEIKLSNVDYKIKNITFEYNFNYENKKTIILTKLLDYNLYNLLSDYFQEECRIKCKLLNSEMSSLEYWKKNIKDIINSAIEDYGKIDNYTLRETLYKLNKECSSFRPTLLVGIIKLFKCKNILDFSSGWGDRLIAAMSCDNIIDFYCGVDPNSCLHPNYQKMINFFGKNSDKYVMIESEFQKAILPDKKYDLIFTSPPYFTLEIYTNEKSQSIIDKENNVDKWLKDFLFISLEKSWNVLVENGYMVIIINDMGSKPEFNFLEKMIKYINSLSYSKYIGLISYGKQENNKIINPQPMWIWQKIIPNNVRILDNSDNLDKLLNPPIKIIQENISINNHNINLYVFRDDFLIGGTKQRMLNRIIKNSKCTEFIYAGPIYGYAQVALAYVCKLMNKKVILFLEKKRPLYPLTQIAKNYGATIIELYKNTSLNVVQKKAELYYKKNKNNKLLCYLPFGLHTKEYIKILAEEITKALPDNFIHPKRIWLVAGSATLLNALYIVFPQTFFNVVQVGRTIWDDLIIKERTHVYISDEKFYNKALQQPPYPTVSTYDAKLWKYVLKYAKENDYIWNVGKD